MSHIYKLEIIRSTKLLDNVALSIPSMIGVKFMNYITQFATDGNTTSMMINKVKYDGCRLVAR